MKTQADLVRGWLRKADSDLTNAGLCIEREQALLTPLLPDILKSSHRSQLESWLVSNAWPGLHTAFVKYRSP